MNPSRPLPPPSPHSTWPASPDQREVTAVSRQLTAFSTEPGVQQLHAALAASTATA
ncbi:hypothetical protein [Micromonospora sp. NPDC048830]|uniref:hypothetical protein n=1 Tax=Micromonospora sp. NPDC048830 TaxID=3364257 RepID=UPI0037139693